MIREYEEGRGSALVFGDGERRVNVVPNTDTMQYALQARVLSSRKQNI